MSFQLVTFLALVLILGSTAQASAAEQSGNQANGALPVASKKVAEKWPLQIRLRVETLLDIFNRENPPTIQSIEEKLGVTLTELQLTPSQKYSFKRIYSILPAGDNRSVLQNSLFSPSYYITGLPGNNTELHLLTISMSEGGYCLSPYDVAIYTGATFSEGDMGTPHARNTYWGQKYEWGMFSQSPTGMYSGSTGIRLTVKSYTGVNGESIVCTENLGTSGTFKRE